MRQRGAGGAKTGRRGSFLGAIEAPLLSAVNNLGLPFGWKRRWMVMTMPGGEDEEGRIVYYESARLLHGRVSPFRGVAFADIFAHFRPAVLSDDRSQDKRSGDPPEWYSKQNPVGTSLPIQSSLGDLDNSDNCSHFGAQESSRGGGGRGVGERYDEFRYVDITRSQFFDGNDGLARIRDRY